MFFTTTVKSSTTNMCYTVISHIVLDYAWYDFLCFIFWIILVFKFFNKFSIYLLIGIALLCDNINILFLKGFIPFWYISLCVHINRLFYIKVHTIYLFVITFTFICVGFCYIFAFSKITAISKQAKVWTVCIKKPKSTVRRPVIHHFWCSVLINNLTCFFRIVFPIAEPTFKLLRICCIFNFRLDRRVFFCYIMYEAILRQGVGQSEPWSL